MPLGTNRDAFQMVVPGIRLPANQYWPLHWHGCWIAGFIFDETCRALAWL